MGAGDGDMVPVARYVDERFGAALLLSVGQVDDVPPFEWTSEVYAFRRLLDGGWQESDSSGGSGWLRPSRTVPADMPPDGWQGAADHASADEGWPLRVLAGFVGGRIAAVRLNAAPSHVTDVQSPCRAFVVAWPRPVGASLEFLDTAGAVVARHRCKSEQ